MEALIIFICVLLVGFIAERAAPTLGLIAYPDQHRHHIRPTPIVGGVSIVLGFMIAHLFIDLGLKPLLPAFALIFFVGVVDDRFKLPSGVRFIAQAITIWLLVRGTGVELTSLGALNIGQEVILAKWSMPLTIFAGIGVINAINMSDGMDGLLGCLVCLILVAICFLSPQTEPWLIAVIAGVSAFLCFNLRINRDQARMFLGDAGSTLLGLLIFYLLVKHSQGSDRAFAPVTALWLMALPLIDAVAVLLIRPLRGASPFAADRIHYHHLLQRHGIGVNQTLLIVIVVQALAMSLGFWMHFSEVAEHLQLWLFLGLFFCYLLHLLWATRSTRPSRTV